MIWLHWHRIGAFACLAKVDIRLFASSYLAGDLHATVIRRTLRHPAAFPRPSISAGPCPVKSKGPGLVQREKRKLEFHLVLSLSQPGLDSRGANPPPSSSGCRCFETPWELRCPQLLTLPDDHGRIIDPSVKGCHPFRLTVMHAGGERERERTGGDSPFAYCGRVSSFRPPPATQAVTLSGTRTNQRDSPPVAL